MADEKAVPADDETPKEEIEVKVEDEGKEPEKSEPNPQGEETPKNEPSTPADGGQGEKQNVGQVIANLGNEKKSIASNLVQLAKSSEANRQQVKEMILNDPALGSYMKSKFGPDYDSITTGEPLKEEVDLDKIREEERAKAKVEAIREQLATNKEKLILENAKNFGFTTQETEIYRQKVDLLGGDEKALNDAALIVNPDKAKAPNKEPLPSGGEAERPAKREVTMSRGMYEAAERRGEDVKELAKDLEKVKGLHTEDSHGRSEMNLPGLK